MNAADDVRSAIRDVGGAIPFDRFMELALYGLHGFYAGEGRAGRRGDFITSPEVGPLFGAVVARFLDAQWVALGRPDELTVVDAGAGPGTLARSVIAAAPACSDALHYVAVERSAAQRQSHPGGVESVAELPAEPFSGVVIANELLDNIPFRLAVFDGGWREAYVADHDGVLVEVLSAAFSPAPAVLPEVAAHGARAPIHDGARAWLERARALVRQGSVVAFDYGRPTTAELAERPWRDWLRTYRGHRRGGHYLADPGVQDITTEIAIDQLSAPDSVDTQAEWLQRWGIDELVTEGRRAWSASAAAPDVPALRMRSRPVEADALCDRSGLGAFLVLSFTSGAIGPDVKDRTGRIA